MNMETREILIESGYEDAAILDVPDLDDAIIGVTDDGNVVYDYEKMVNVLMEEDGLSRFEAIDLIEHKILSEIPNIEVNPPIIMKRLEDL